MYSTTGYLYQQTHEVLIHEEGASGSYYNRSWQKVYSKNIKASRGVDNVIHFRFLNQEQKPVNISGQEFIVRVMDQAGEELLFTKELEVLNAASGFAKLTIIEADLDNVSPQLANYSISVKNGNLERPVFVDDYSNARGTLEIADEVFPAFMPSLNVIIPSYQLNTIQYSSEWQPTHYLQTMQYQVTDFIGTITVQASLTTDSNEWFDINAVTYSESATATEYMNIEGLYSVIRLKVEPTNGTIDKILVR